MRSKGLVFVLAVALFSQSLALSVNAQSPQIVEPLVKRLHDALKLDDQQLIGVRGVFAKHAPKINELRARAEKSPYSPEIPPDLDKEQKEIRSEISELLTEEQKAKLATVDTRLPVPVAPPFILINLPPRASKENAGTPAALAAGERLIPIPSSSQKPRNSRLTDDQRILHLLNRVTFGPRPGDVDRVKQMGIAKFIEEQLNPDAIDDSDLEKRLLVLPTLQLSSVELFQFYPPPNAITQREKQPNPPPVYGRPQQVVGELVQQKLARAVSTNRQLQEVMTDFWLNHFNVFAFKEADQWMISSYERDVIRPHSLGKFRDLLRAVASSPAMLYYLDNWLSFAPDAKEPRPPRPATPQPPPRAVPNIAADGNQQEKDSPQMGVKQQPNPTAQNKTPSQSSEPSKQTAAPTQNPNPAPAVAKPQPRKRDINENYARELMELHTLGVDGGYTQKDVQEVARCFTGWTIDRPYQNGAFVFRPWMHDQGAKVVLGTSIPAGGGVSDGLAVLDILARHPSTARFVSKKICQRLVADDPPAALVDRAAQVFLKSDGDIREVVRTILNSPEFNSPQNFRAKVKSPLELAASAIRGLDGDTNGAPALHEWLRRMGEPLYQYQFPTGYSEKSSSWVNTGVFFNRINFAVALANNQIAGTIIDYSRLVASAASGDEMVKQLSALVVHTELSTETSKAVRNSLESSKPGDQQKHILELLLGSAEFQRR